MPALILMMLALPAGSAVAQVYGEGSIRGYIRDEQGAVLPGVTVTATSPTAPGTRTAVSDAEGMYRIVNLPPATYTVAAELQGFSRFVRDNVIVRAGLNVGVDVTLKVGTLSETVEVKAETPMLEASSAVPAVNISGDFQRRLPLSSRRNVADALTLAPGVSSIQARFQTYYLHGADQDSNVLTVDGADVSYLLQSNSLAVQLSTEAIADTQVKTGGADASAPLGTGAVMNIASISGTNQFKGAAGIALQPKSWNDNNFENGAPLTVDVIQPDLSLGGPIRRDRWWIFGAYRYSNNHTGVPRTPLQVESIRALEPGFTFPDNKQRASYYFFKGTGQLSPNHQLLAFYQYDRNPYGGIQATEAGEFRDIIPGGSVYTARVSSVWGPSWTTRMMASYNKKEYEIKNHGDNVPGVNVHQSAFQAGSRLTGTGVLATLDASTSSGAFYPLYYVTLSADATYHKTGWGGTHDLQLGVYLQPWRHNETHAQFGEGGFRRVEAVLANPANPSAGYIPFYRQIYDVSELKIVDIDSHDNALYVQDTWAAHPRLTVNAGVRVDFIKRTDNIFDVVTQDSVEVGPRFGVNYVLTADRRNAIRASWSRVHENMSMNETTGGTTTAGYTEYFDLDLNGSFETVFVVPGQTSRTLNRIVDLDNYHQAHVDEWTVGYRRQFPGELSMDVGFVRREFRDRPTLIETNGIYENSVFLGYRDENFNEFYRLESNQYNWHVYSALDFRVSKQTNRLQFIGGYTRQWRHISGTFQPNDPASFISPEAFPNDRGIGSIRGSTAGGVNSLSGSDGFGSPQWRDHNILGGVTFMAPWDIVLAANYIYQSGLWVGPVVTRIAAPDPAFGPPTVRLSNGRVVANPLATTIRFANPTRGEGQFTTNGMHQLNVRVGHDVHFGPRRLELALDVLNVLNYDADQTFAGGANQTYSPFYKSGGSRQFPRAAQVSARFVF